MLTTAERYQLNSAIQVHSWEAPLQWNEVIGGADGAGPRQGS